MSWTDRVVEHPNRVVLTPVSGETNTYDMTYAEGEVEEEGTLLNASNLNAETNELIDAKLGGNITPSNMACGTSYITGNRSAGSVVSVSVSYGKTFDTIPIVVATAGTGVPNKRNVSVANVTTTGFTLYWTTTVATTGTNGVYWFAIAL